MITRWWSYLTVILGSALAGEVLSDPAMAAGLDEARRRTGGGVGTVLGGLCCLIIVVLVGGGVFLGIFLSRRRKR